MNLEDHREKFNKRWNISSDYTPEEAFKGFKKRILYLLNNIDSLVTNEGHISFCQYYAIEPKFTEVTVYDEILLESGEPKQITIINYLKQLKFSEFLRCIEVIHSLEKSKEYGKDNLNEYLFKEISTLIEYSSGVNFRLGKDNKGYIFFYKSGEELLDKRVVNHALSFLRNDENKLFVEALKFFEQKKYTDSAERLRKTIESFLRYKLENKKGLKENIKELGKTLKNNKSDKDIRKVIFSTFGYLDNYFNDNSKHKSKVDENENEYLIYQCSLLMNYINRLL